MISPSEQAISTFEELAGLKERRYATVKLRGKEFRLRSLTSVEMRRLRGSLYDSDGEPDTDRMGRIPYLLLCRCLINDQGNPFLSEQQLDDLDEVDGGILESLGAACLEHTGWHVQYDLASIEDTAKNS